MAFIDNKGKLFGIINIIDLAVLLVILAVASAVGLKAINKAEDLTGANLKTIEAKIYIEKLRPENAQQLAKEKRVFLNEFSAPVEVVKVEVIPMQITGFNEKGEAVATEDPLLKTVFVTVRGTGTVNSGTDELFLQGQPVSIGYGVALKGKFLVSGFAIETKVVD